MHRQVDDVGPVLTVLVAVAHQFPGDHVTVGLVVAQDAGERVASLRLRVLRSDRMSASSSQSWGRRGDILPSISDVLLSYYPDEGSKVGDLIPRTPYSSNGISTSATPRAWCCE